MSKAIGIDLGTSNSCLSIYEQGQAVVISNAEGKRTTPSVIAFSKNETLVGEAAIRQAITNPTSTIYSIKRFIGANFDEREEEAKLVPYKVEKGNGGLAVVNINGTQYTPQELSAKVLSKLKQSAEDHLGEKVTQAVITVPAYFNDSQRQATKDAAKIAGLEVLRLINEPTAASIAYGLDKKDEQKIVAVVDIGGGTTDFSILEIGSGVIEVLSTSGDAHLAGDNLDEAIIQHLLETFKAESGIDISKDPMAMQRLKEAAVKAKIELSSSAQTDINLPFLTANESGPLHLNISLSRSQFEALITSLIDKMFEPCHQAIKDANLSVDKIDDVLLVGGSTRIPLIQSRVKEIFGQEPNKGVNPDEVVAAGAAIQAGVLQGDVEDVLLLDVTPLSLGIETMGGISTKLIERNTTIPTQKSQTFSTAADNQSAVTINVLQGEREFAKDNKTLGQFTLTDIPPAPRGVPQISVEFSIDTNGIVSVSAKDLGTGKEQNITISNESKLSEDEIDKMVKDAEQNAEADKQRKAKIEAKNNLDSLVFTAEKLINDNQDVDDESKAELEAALEEAKKADEEDVDSLTSAHKQLETVVHKISTAIYQKANQQQAADSTESQSEAPSKDDDDVVDAEFEETD